MLKKTVADYRFASVLWFGLALATIVRSVFIKEQFDSYLIFDGVFWHTLKQLFLYAAYPEEYFDINHCSPFLDLITAPFTILPRWVSCSFWIMVNTAFLYWATRQLPLPKSAIIGVPLIAAHDMYTAVAIQQFNISIIALLVGAFVSIQRGESHRTTLFIVTGLLTKLYGVIGLAFFFFAKDKWRFIASEIAWLVLLFCLPMLYLSPDYTVSQYYKWYVSLAERNVSNLNTASYNLRNFPLLGFLQCTGIYDNNLVTLTVTLGLFALPYLHIQQYKDANFRLLLLTSVSIFLCLLSTDTENNTYVIAYVGIGVWFVVDKLPIKLEIVLLVLTILVSLSPTDMFKPLREPYIIRHSLRAVPPALMWLAIVYEMCFLEFKNDENNRNCSALLQRK